MKKKPIVISMGEPSGIGSEIVIKTWILRKKKQIKPFFIVDNSERIESVIDYFNFKAKIKVIDSPEQVFDIFQNFIPIFNIGKKIDFELGKPSQKNSKFVIESLKKSFEFVKKNQASSIITLPICKKTVKQNGFSFNGQTEYLGFLSRKYINKNVNEIMILATTKPTDSGKNLIVGLATTHIPLNKIIKSLTKKELKKKIIVFNDCLKKIWGKKKPLIGVLSLNPHAGEDGIIGNEEKKIILPVIKELKSININLEGPLSGDTCFFKKHREKFDGMFCMYHDQGLSPLKTLDFYNSINITGGLPVLRVSPDHGPAFNIAKKKIAKIDSLISCFKFLRKYS